MRLIGRYGEFEPTPREALVNLHRWPVQQSPRLRYTKILSIRPSPLAAFKYSTELKNSLMRILRINCFIDAQQALSYS